MPAKLAFTDIIGVEQEVLGLVLANDLEAVILRYADADECLIDDTADFLPVGRLLAFAKIDTNEWHDLFLFLSAAIGLPHKQG